MTKLVDLADLTWEQKEQVLRELFARMNGAKIAKQMESGASRKKAGKQLALVESRSTNNALDKYDTDEEQELVVGKQLQEKQLTVSAKALANAMYVRDLFYYSDTCLEYNIQKLKLVLVKFYFECQI